MAKPSDVEQVCAGCYLPLEYHACGSWSFSSCIKQLRHNVKPRGDYAAFHRKDRVRGFLLWLHRITGIGECCDGSQVDVADFLAGVADARKHMAAIVESSQALWHDLSPTAMCTVDPNLALRVGDDLRVLYGKTAIRRLDNS